MQLADAEPADPLGPLADTEVDEVLPDAGSLDEPDIVDPLPAPSPASTPGVDDRVRKPLMLSARTNRKFASTPATLLRSLDRSIDWRDKKIAPTSELPRMSWRARSTV